MPKGQQKSNREKKKPKQDKDKGKSAAATTFGSASNAGKPSGKRK